MGYISCVLNDNSKQYLDKINIDDSILYINLLNRNLILCLKMIQLVFIDKNFIEAKLFYYKFFIYTRTFEKFTIGYQFDLYKLALAVLFNRDKIYCDNLINKIKKAKTSFDFEDKFISIIIECFYDVVIDNDYVNNSLNYALVVDIVNNYGKIVLLKNNKVVLEDCFVETNEEIFLGYKLFCINNIHVVSNTLLDKEEVIKKIEII